MQRPTEPTEATFSRRMREAREAQGATQSAVATALAMMHGIKLDSTAITRMESGQRAIRLGEAVAIAAVLGMTVDELLRPVLSPDEQLRQAARQLETSEWRAAEARAEFTAARRRLERLRERLTLQDEIEGGNHGESE